MVAISCLGVFFQMVLIQLTVQSPATTTTTTTMSPDGDIASIKDTSVNSDQISYFWHQKGRDLVPLWPLESPTASGKKGSTPSNGDRVILIHRISDDDGSFFKKQNDPNFVLAGKGTGREENKAATTEVYDDNNIFVFCLMFLFGLIICGLMWCLCTASRHQTDTPTQTDSYSSRRMNTRFGSRRRADIEVILPYSTGDLPPSYDDIVADFEKLGQQCILPSYKDIMGRKGAESVRPSPSPPPRYTSPTGSFSAQGSPSTNQEEANSVDAELHRPSSSASINTVDV